MKFLIKNLSLFFLSLWREIIAREKNNNLTYLCSLFITSPPTSIQETKNIEHRFLSRIYRRILQDYRFSKLPVASSNLLETFTCVHGRGKIAGDERKGDGGVRILRSNERENAVARPTSVLDPGQLILDGRVATFRFPETHGKVPLEAKRISLPDVSLRSGLLLAL